MSNYGDNAKAFEKFRKELLAMLGDIREIDRKVLNRAVNEGVAFAKSKTKPGDHPNPVTFTVKNGPKVGTEISFKVSNPGVGGFLRKNWHKLPTKRSAGRIETEIVNTADYASYWNDGHRIVTKKGGPTKGFVPGKHVLEKTQKYVEGRMTVLFEREVKEVQKRHDD